MGVEIFKIWDDYISPATDQEMDVGSSALKFKDLYIGGVAYLNSILLGGNIVMPSTERIVFRDANIYIGSDIDGRLDIGADIAIDLNGHVYILDGKNIILDTVTGTRIGTATNQLLGFYNATPIVQPVNNTDLRTALINLGLLASGGATPLNLNGGTLTAVAINLSDGSDKNYTVSAYAAGTVYALTGTPALITFGTTSPSLTINKAGTYRVCARAQVTRNNSTQVGVHTVTLKLRRTNNTAADLSNSSTTYNDDAHTTSYATERQNILPEIIYTTANTNDVIELWGSVSSTGTGGTHDVDEACIIAQRLY